MWPLQGMHTRVLDTRKTLPGLRLAQKYAVRVGGGINHRVGLFDAVMVKENHIAAAGSIAAVVTQAKALHPGLPIIVEVESLQELLQAIDSRVDRVLLDEFDESEMCEAVTLTAGRVPLEVSGGVRWPMCRALARPAWISFRLAVLPSMCRRSTCPCVCCHPLIGGW
jgi:nicotinate-nucleotide pyrophosphorylase (carboxylating)